MADNKKLPRIVTKKDDSKGKDTDDSLPAPPPVSSELTFEPRVKKAGELILANDWNDMQTELKNDLDTLASSMSSVSGASNIMVASGIASHGIFVELNWDIKPHVIASFSGSLSDDPQEINKPYRCYVHDISSRGFQVYARSNDAMTEGMVSWLAIGISGQ